MKWQGYNEKAAERVNNFFVRVTNSRSVVVTALVATLIIVATASSKWGG